MKFSYDHQKIEQKWRKFWEQNNLYQTELTSANNTYYCLDMFPYPSGEGLHVGHWRGYVLSDYFARHARLQGKTVLHPMGFDAFGLPAENAAIKKNSHPKEFTDKAIVMFREQLDAIGASYDWSKTVNTSDPKYYKWTQWLFLQFFKHGLAEKRLSLVNWCPNDQTVLANEQVVNGSCERCGSKVTKKELSQWYLKITEFAEDLLNGLDTLEWPDNVKALQRNWIGRSEGAFVHFHSEPLTLKVFTTRPDTLFGVTAVVLAPEHPDIEKLTQTEYQAAVKKYIEDTKLKSDVDRQKEVETNKTGVFTGSYVLHPLTHKEIPIWIADYVLPGYGTGAVMLVPAHDERDYQFAKTHNLPITEVISGGDTLPYTEEGVLKNSGIYDEQTSEKARENIAKDLERRNLGGKATTFRLRDWLVSRQRYWGAPIPIVYDPEGTPHAIKDEHLPLLLPTDVDFQPGGESPVKRSKAYQELAEKLYGKGWRFETDTLDTFVDSSWYYLRFLSSQDEAQPFDKDLVTRWFPVDLYIGGIEHAILHLLYARFVYMFLVKYKYIQPTQSEPFKKLFNIGMITLHGAKMSKSKGNIVSPNPLVEHYGTDALRGIELFVGPVENSMEWNSRGINGVHRFLIKVAELGECLSDGVDETQAAGFDRYLRSINEMIESFRMNTVISEAMKFVNEISNKEISREVFERFVITLSPAFPFLAEELWSSLGHDQSIFTARWPKTFGTAVGGKMVKVLINQKFVGEIPVNSDESEKDVMELVQQDPQLRIKLQNKNILRVIYKPNEILNVITQD